MEVCPSTSLPLRSSAFRIHWQSDFCVCRDKTTNSVALSAELSSMVSPRRPSFQIPRLAAWTAVALDCVSSTSPCLIQGMEPNILAGTDSGSPLRAGHASNECRVSVKSTQPAMKANRVSSTRPEASHVALAGSDRDRTSQASCCPQSSHAPL